MKSIKGRMLNTWGRTLLEDCAAVFSSEEKTFELGQSLGRRKIVLTHCSIWQCIAPSGCQDRHYARGKQKWCIIKPCIMHGDISVKQNSSLPFKHRWVSWPDKAVLKQIGSNRLTFLHDDAGQWRIPFFLTPSFIHIGGGMMTSAIKIQPFRSVTFS